MPWCLVSEAPHSGAIPCAMAGQNFHQYNPVYNPPFLDYDFSIEFQFSCIILEIKIVKMPKNFLSLIPFMSIVSIGSYFKVISSVHVSRVEYKSRYKSGVEYNFIYIFSKEYSQK